MGKREVPSLSAFSQLLPYSCVPLHLASKGYYSIVLRERQIPAPFSLSAL